MSLTIDEMTDVIKKCKFYKDLHIYDKYIGPFVVDPIKTYDTHACRKLEAIRLATDIRRPQSFLDRVYTYKTIRNMDREHFSEPKKYNYIIPIILIVLLIILIKYRLKYRM